MNDRFRSFSRLVYVVMGGSILLSAAAAGILFFHPGYRNTSEMLRELTRPGSAGQTSFETLNEYGSLFSLALFLIIFAVIWFRRR